MNQLIILPTNNESVICGTKELQYRGLHPQIDSLQNHHLYILSDDKIEEGEFDKLLQQGLYFESNNGIIKIITNKRVKTIGTYKKIIATTDTSLTIVDSTKSKIYDVEYETFVGQKYKLPQIPHSFIKYYITEYNKGNIITEVNVEYKDYSIPNGAKSYVSNTGDVIDISCKLLINPDNTINIILNNPREKNDMDDFIINGPLTIQELYNLAKSEGFENRELFFSIKNPSTKQHFSTHNVVSFGKGWTKNTAIMNLTWEDLPHNDSNSNT